MCGTPFHAECGAFVSSPCCAEITALQPNLVHNSFLEELVFWMVKFEFPQKLVCFLLNMLPDTDYKVLRVTRRELARKLWVNETLNYAELCKMTVQISLHQQGWPTH